MWIGRVGERGEGTVRRGWEVARRERGERGREGVTENGVLRGLVVWDIE